MKNIKIKKNLNNSSIAPATDMTTPQKNQTLKIKREKTNFRFGTFTNRD